jgi:hypothetical protein
LTGRWGVYAGSHDGVYPAWQSASGREKELLAKVALRPRVRWVGGWIPDRDVYEKLRADIRQEQKGDPDVLVPIAVFREFANGESRRDEPITEAQQDSYRGFVDNAARAIGRSRVMIVLEPDLAVGLKGWRPNVRLEMVSYASRVFGALPRTTVYLDAGDADWLKVPDAVSMLLKAGIRHVRGFALGATHYSSTRANIRYGAQVVAALADAGVPGRHFVVDTADNGRPFTWPQYWAAHPRGDFDNAETCTSRADRRCVTLGIPPTTRVTARRWRLGPEVRQLAGRHVDAFAWFGRPWLVRQASPFSRARTLQVARTTRW